MYYKYVYTDLNGMKVEGLWRGRNNLKGSKGEGRVMGLGKEG